MKRKVITALLVVAISTFAFSYDVVLKNGKVRQGKLIQEDDERIILEDSSGIRINIKKTNIDIQKTEEANKKVEPEPQPAPESKPELETKTEPPKPKKPARVYTQDDVSRLRGEIPMDSGQVEYEGGDTAPPSEERGEEYWRSRSAELRSQLQQAEAAYQERNAWCQRLKGATIQTHVVVNEKGETQNMAETTEEACQRAEDAKGQLDRIRGEYDSLMEQAKQEAIPPGWTRED